MSTEKNPYASALGRKGGLARAQSQTPEQRKALARHAVNIRWHGKQKPLELGDTFPENGGKWSGQQTQWRCEGCGFEVRTVLSPTFCFQCQSIQRFTGFTPNTPI